MLYRVFLIVGVYGCAEDSAVGYFHVTANSFNKSTEARERNTHGEKDDLSVFPIPANDELNLINSTSNSSIYYSLYDLKGTIVKQGNFAKETSVSLNSLSSGIYFIRCENINGELIHNQKIIKQ